MPNGLRVGVLSPFVGGDYFGEIIAGIHAATVADGGRLLAVQTLAPGSKSADQAGVPDVSLPISWQHFDAAVVISRAATAGCVRRLQRAGKPVVVVNHKFPGVRSPIVAPDNRSGLREAVSHLAEHGHERIAFAGFLGVHDIYERYQGYLEAMRTHGLRTGPDLFFEAPDNEEGGGLALAGQLLRAAEKAEGKLPATAVVVATDRNVIGLLEGLQAAGLSVPADLAVVGFDDIIQSQYMVPSLSTIRQPLAELGTLAYERLRAMADAGTTTGEEVNYVPTRFVRRDSCGCGPVELQLSQAQARRQFRDNAYLQLTLNTHYELGVELLRTHEQDPRDMAWLGRTPARAGFLGLWPRPADGEEPEDTGDASRPGGAGGQKTEVVGRPDPSDPDPQIEVVGGFRADGRVTTSVGRAIPVSAFPPEVMFESADDAAGQIVCVVRVRSESRDWGVLAAVSQIQSCTPSGREMINHSGSLLAIALDHDAVLRSLKDQKERLGHAALFDHLTGLPNRTLLLDRLRQSGLRAGRRPDRQFALLFLDLDGFKGINDSLGHAAGDQLLVGVARRLTKVLRRTDTAARLGGDEFVVLLDTLRDPKEAITAAERVRRALTEPYVLEDGPVTIGVSIGISRSDEGSLDPDELLRRADTAMYQAKTTSRGEAAASGGAIASGPAA